MSLPLGHLQGTDATYQTSMSTTSCTHNDRSVAPLECPETGQIQRIQRGRWLQESTNSFFIRSSLGFRVESGRREGRSSPAEELESLPPANGENTGGI